MKAVTVYECEVCGERHDERDAAVICEAGHRGVTLKLGTIFQVSSQPHVVFATAHSQILLLWACRDDGQADSTQYYCGTPPRLYEEIVRPNRSCPAFARMVDHLRSKGSPVRVWNDTASVELQDEHATAN